MHAICELCLIDTSEKEEDQKRTKVDPMELATFLMRKYTALRSMGEVELAHKLWKEDIDEEDDEDDKEGEDEAGEDEEDDKAKEDE
jgi:hypothetical protein